jgi:hypothetical protein
MSASDNSDPSQNGRRYEVASANPRSSLGGVQRLPSRHREHVETITDSARTYTIAMGGTLDAENTLTLSGSNCTIAFQPNLSLTLENTGTTPVTNPRLVINDRGNWYTIEDMLAEWTRGAKDDQERAYLLWQNMRSNTYHSWPVFSNNVPHDPVRLWNIFGFNLCDDAGNSGCSLFVHDGLLGSRNWALNGHVQCEAQVGDRREFLDVDMDCFYLDRENELPVGVTELGRDHDLARRELNYGEVVDRWTDSDYPAALFGADDKPHRAEISGHRIDYTLRPGEKVVFRWDNQGKFPAESAAWAHRPLYYGNSTFVYPPRLDLEQLAQDGNVAVDLGPGTIDGGKLAGLNADAHLDLPVQVPYLICGGTLKATFVGREAGDQFTVSLSLDGKEWQPLWSHSGAGKIDAAVALDPALDVQNGARYGYTLRLGLGSAGNAHGANLAALELTTLVMAAPASLPRLRLGDNQVVYSDSSQGPHQLRITHEWQETDAVTPLDPPAAPQSPAPGAEVRETLVTYTWPAVAEATAYHLQASRRPDFAWPYRTSLDVIIPATTWVVPFSGIYSPDTTNYWRLRARDNWGAWSPWSPTWTFTWRGPRVPVGLAVTLDGSKATLHWEPNPRGPKPVRYEVYGSDEKGFSTRHGEHDVPGRGKVPGNFLTETTGTSLQVAGPGAEGDNANRVYYRVVAVDENGVSSGCSDYAELPHPFVMTAPVTAAKVGQAYRYQLAATASLGDLQNKPTGTLNSYDYRYWDIEHNQFALTTGPAWLQLDAATGLLTGTPTEAGRSTVTVEVTNQLGGKAEQTFALTVTP